MLEDKTLKCIHGEFKINIKQCILLAEYHGLLSENCQSSPAYRIVLHEGKKLSNLL